jgi:hypothetical protein
MFVVGRLLRSLGIFLTPPGSVSGDEILPDYQLFFDDLKKVYEANTKSELQDIFRITADRQGYRRLRDSAENLLEAEIKSRFSELLDRHYDRYRTAMQKCQWRTDEAVSRIRVDIPIKKIAR